MRWRFPAPVDTVVRDTAKWKEMDPLVREEYHWFGSPTFQLTYYYLSMFRIARRRHLFFIFSLSLRADYTIRDAHCTHSLVANQGRGDRRSCGQALRGASRRATHSVSRLCY